MISKRHIGYILITFLLGIQSSLILAKGKTLIYEIDFSTKPEGNALPWLKKQGYTTLLDSDKLKLRFENGHLTLSTDKNIAGVIGLRLNEENFIYDTSYIEIEWGVIRQPKGINWEKGNNRVPIALMFFFGMEKISSGLPFGINSVPYFISPFIGDKEQVDKTYIGKLYKEGGRYICAAVTTGSDKVITTRLMVDPKYLRLFHKSEIPPITAIAFQMNTKDTAGGATAFIRKIRFLSEK